MRLELITIVLKPTATFGVSLISIAKASAYESSPLRVSFSLHSPLSLMGLLSLMGFLCLLSFLCILCLTLMNLKKSLGNWQYVMLVPNSIQREKDAGNLCAT